MLEHLPDLITLIVKRNSGKKNWHISDFINCIKEEVDAREYCDFIKGKNDYEHLTNTTNSLLVTNYTMVISAKYYWRFKFTKYYEIAERATILQLSKEKPPAKKTIKVKNLQLAIMKKMKRKWLCL